MRACVLPLMPRSPFQSTTEKSAVVACVPWLAQIAHVVLAQLPDAKVQHAKGVEALLQTVSPGARLTNVALARTDP